MVICCWRPRREGRGRPLSPFRWAAEIKKGEENARPAAKGSEEWSGKGIKFDVLSVFLGPNAVFLK